MHSTIARIVMLSRWGMVPLLVGLTIAMLLLIVAFFIALWNFSLRLFGATDTEVVMSLLTLIDFTLVGSLIIIVVRSGYENFVERIDRSDADTGQAWMSKVTFSALKQKLFASMMAICGITMLKALMKLETSVSEAQIKWLVVANVIFVVSYAVLSIIDIFALRRDGRHE
jgi:uncharacterized protein (TIGR00645 family)